MVNYIDLLEKSNSFKDKIVKMPKPEYKTIYGTNIKGIVFKNKFYDKCEYDEMFQRKNDTHEKQIAKTNEECKS